MYLPERNSNIGKQQLLYLPQQRHEMQAFKHTALSVEHYN